jgi:hypothetical protein
MYFNSWHKKASIHPFFVMNMDILCKNIEKVIDIYTCIYLSLLGVIMFPSPPLIKIAFLLNKLVGGQPGLKDKAP